MALLDSIRNLGKRASENLEKNIGGLLGEDVSKMSEEERRAIRQQAMAAIFNAMAQGTTPQAGLRQVAADVAARREAADAQRRQAASESMLSDISTRLYGGPVMLEDVEGGPAIPLSTQRKPSAQGAQEVMRMLVGTQTGKDIAAQMPDIVRLAQEGASGRTVGGSVYNPLTGEFSRPPMQEPMARPVARPSAAAPSGAAPAPVSQRFRVLTADEMAQANLPAGTSAQIDTQTGQIKLLSQVPATQRAGEAAKGTAVTRVDAVANKIDEQLGRVSTGGPLGMVGALSRVFDSQDAKLFESYRQQLSSALRTALRIPGEGALSDFEQRQYGLQLPELGQSAENNRQILRSLRDQVRLAAGMQIPQGDQDAGDVDYIYQNGKLVPARKR